MNNLLQQWQLFSFSHARVFQISPFSPNGSSKESVVGVERELFKPKERRWHSRLGSTHTLHCLPVAEDEWPEFTHHLLLHIFAHTCLFSSKANPSIKTRLQYDFRIIVIKGPLSTMKAIKCLWLKKKCSDEIFGLTQVNHRWTGRKDGKEGVPGLAQRALQSDCLVWKVNILEATKPFPKF